MKKLIFAVLICVVSIPTVVAQQGHTANDNDVVGAAKTFVELLSQNNFAGAVSSFDDTMRTALPPDKLRETWNAVISQTGAFKRQVRTRTEKNSGYDIVYVTCDFEKTLLDTKVVFDQSRRIAGLFFVPTVEEVPAKYIKEGAFTEKEVTVGTPLGALPGTLTVPNGPGPFPAVVLVHGSGQSDRDESLGATKPFRDLALGLASNGIAVLRYDKRTKLYGEKLGTHFTVKEETIDDALTAVEVLRKQEHIDNKRIFVLGHSLGGMLVPRIAKLDQNIAGFIIMAGATKPLEDAILEQSIYLVSLRGPISKADEQRLERIKEQVTKVKNLKPSDADSPIFLFGAPPSYWLDLRGYEPATTAATLKQRLLILQGERDYQVTINDFAKWKTALGTKSNVTFKTYPKLNHLFMEGEGKSVPSEYDRPTHVSEAVIIDIVQWIK